MLFYIAQRIQDPIEYYQCSHCARYEQAAVADHQDWSLARKLRYLAPNSCFCLVIAPADMATISPNEYLALIMIYVKHYRIDPLDSPPSIHSVASLEYHLVSSFDAFLHSVLTLSYPNHRTKWIISIRKNGYNSAGITV